MAEPEERSLDDFFAKRDKKKKKDKVGAGGSTTSAKGSTRPPDASQSAASLGSATAKVVKKEKTGKNEGQDSQQEKEDDEWKDFEQKEVDYSGLRIQSLQIGNEKEDDDMDKKEEQGADWEEAGGSGSDKTSGPWNKAATVQPPENIAAEAPEPVQSSGVYRPPAARASAPPRRQGPPEIYSDAQFPSLQSTAKHIESRRDKEIEKTFEMVKHKNRAREEAAKNQAVRLQLDNQYAVLGEQ
ncbi:protein CDV3 homolog [Spea bombifrons]|uniref:protein CDV3 homolog n=1 Tax=Spea bombifrons TaxID=233779 RepID=UPI00234ABA15|nr:protein CDV3 homolog [Spea bombifrons]